MSGLRITLGIPLIKTKPVSFDGPCEPSNDGVNHPGSAIKIQSTNQGTNDEGFMIFNVTAGNPAIPENVHRALMGIDSQIYLLSIEFTYDDEEHSSDFNIAVLIFYKYDVVKNPDWYTHIQPIFQRYANLYPVMRSIVDMANYDSVVASIPKFTLGLIRPESDGSHMPVTRDLPPSKRQTILNWLENPILGPLPTPTIAILQHMLQMAIEVEFSTIPLYLAALMSIKEGYNVEVASLLKKVVIQEMLHMTLACNILNAIGGTPIIASPSVVPVYPAAGLPGGLRPDLVLRLKKLSKAHLHDTFLSVEQPGTVIDSECRKQIMSLNQNRNYEEINIACPLHQSTRSIGQFYNNVLHIMQIILTTFILIWKDIL